jgi:hypothetical protein
MDDEQATVDVNLAGSRMEEAATEPLAEEQEQILQPPSQTGGRKAKYPCLACGKNVTGR